MSGSQPAFKKDKHAHSFGDAPGHVVPVWPREGAREEVIRAGNLCSAGGA